MSELKELNDLLKLYQRGFFTEGEAFPRIAGLARLNHANVILDELPPDIRSRFCQWVRATPAEGWEHPIGSTQWDPTPEQMLEFKRLAGDEEQ